MNNARSNLAFDDGGEPVLDNDGPTGCRRDGDSWEPRDAVKGDVARMLFYAPVRYENAAFLVTEPVAELQGNRTPGLVDRRWPEVRLQPGR